MHNMNRLSDTIELLVDVDLGIIKTLQEVQTESGSPQFFRYWALASDTKAFGYEQNFSRSGGVSAIRDVAMAKAIGEAVERYCAAIYHFDDLLLCSFKEAPFDCVKPKEFALYDQNQYHSQGFVFVPFTEDSLIRWVPSIDPLRKEIVHIPAQMVYLPYYSHGYEVPIVQPISTGLAFHSSMKEAAITAICEIIERDAFMITWQAMLAPPQILRETLNPYNTDLIRRFEEANNSVTLFDITTDIGIPVILSVLRSQSDESPPLVFAAASSPDPEEAVRKSLEELEHTRHYCKMIFQDLKRLDVKPNFSNVVDQKSHLNFWCDRKNEKYANFIFESDIRIKFDDLLKIYSGSIECDLGMILEKIKNAGYRTLLCDVTTPDVCGLGFTVIRAVIPGLHPMFMGYKYRALGGQRLWSIPQKLGYAGINEGQDNPVPHPYP